MAKFEWVNRVARAYVDSDYSTIEEEVSSIQNRLEGEGYEIQFVTRVSDHMGERVLVSARRPLAEEKASG